MGPDKRKLEGLLLQPIELADARPNSLAVQLGADLSEDDVHQHVRDAAWERIAELDKQFNLTPECPDIWQQRIKALLSYEFDVDTTDPQGWARVFFGLARVYLPGFSVKPRKQKHGLPKHWSRQRLMQLYADVAVSKKQDFRSIRQICKDLRIRSPYRSRWGQYSAGALREAYRKARSLESTSVEFALDLYGGEFLMAGKQVSRDDAAIARHSIKKTSRPKFNNF